MTWRLAAGTPLVRVAVDELGSTEPSGAATARRFSPVRDARSRRVPVLYGGVDLACALGETVFHDLPDDAGAVAEVFRADLVAVRAGTITVSVDVELADLTDPTLRDYGYARSEVVDTAPAAYAVTRNWGQHAWATTACTGLVWNSRRSPDRLAFMFFVAPPAPADRWRALARRQLRVVDPPLPLHEGDGLAAVMEAAAARNVTVVL